MSERYNGPTMERMETRDTVDAFNKKMEKIWPQSNPDTLVESGVYTREQVDHSNKVVAKAKSRFAERQQGLGLDQAAEYLFLEGAYKNGWLEKGAAGVGDAEVYLVRTTEYDDYIEGVDMVAAIRLGQNEPWRYIGIDVTVSENDGELYDKFTKTNASLITENPHLPIIKYYTPDQEDKGEKAGQISLTKTVVILDKEKVFQAVNNYMNEGKIDLQNSEVQFEVINTLREQLFNQLRTVVQDVEGSDLSKASELEVVTRARKHLDKGVNPAVDEILDSQSALLEYFSSLISAKEKGLAA